MNEQNILKKKTQSRVQVSLFSSPEFGLSQVIDWVSKVAMDMLQIVRSEGVPVMQTYEYRRHICEKHAHY